MYKFFDQRNRKISNLNLMADSLGYALRENVSLFSVDDLDSFVAFVTESGKIIQGNYYMNDVMLLDNILVESGEVFSDEERFDASNKDQISSFVDSIYSDNLAEAGEVFDNIIESWNARVMFNKTIEKLNEQTESFNNTFNILQTEEFQRFLEVSENISKFLSENRERISEIPEIVNAVRLSDTVSKAFDIPRMSEEELVQKGSFEVHLTENRDIYEMVCRQELLNKEILESKKSFDTVWVTEPCISNLASKMYDSDEDIAKALVEAFVEIPYISLVSKKQLSTTISNCLNTLHESTSYSKVDLKQFVGKLFEMKKPLKQMISTLLHEKYGVNVNNLKEAPTFKTLLNTQVLIFESLSKLAPRGSIIKESLNKLSEMLKSKNGVEAIDVNSGIKFLFTESGFTDIYVEEGIASTFSLAESIVDGETVDTVDYILENLLFIEKKEIVTKSDAEKKAKVKDEKKKKDTKTPLDIDTAEDEAEAVEEEDDVSMSTKELMDSLKELEDSMGTEDDLEEL